MPQLAIMAIATAAGSLVQGLLSPRQKAKPTDKGKMEDIRIQGSDYGALIPRVWGRTRIAGNLVVSTGVDHYTVTSTPSGGKKSPTGAETTHIYKTSIAVLHSRSNIEIFNRVWADSTLVVNNQSANTGRYQAEDATLSGGAASYVDADAEQGDAVNGLGNGGKAVFDFSGTSGTSGVTIDPGERIPWTRINFYYKCTEDRTATVTTDDGNGPVITTVDFLAASEWSVKTILLEGWTDDLTFENASAAAPDLDVIAIQKFTRPGGGGEKTYRISGVKHPSLLYPLDLDDPSEFYNYPAEYVKDGATGIYTVETPAPDVQYRFYTGTETQTADERLKTWLDTRYGAGQGILRMSAMRPCSYMLAQDLTLTSSNVPNFTFETDTGDDTVNGILTDLLADVNIDSGDYNLTATAGLTQIGFLESTSTSRKQLIEALARYHFFRLAEVDGDLTTVVDTFTSAGTIAENSLRAHTDGEEMPRFDAEVARKESHLLPREVRVSVMQPDLDYHNESVTAQLFADLEATESVEYAFPIVDTAAAARTVAEKLLLKAHAEDTAYEFWGMPETAQCAIGDVVTVPINGVDKKVRIEKKQMTLPIGKIRFQGVEVNPFTPTYYQDAVTQTVQIARKEFANTSFPRNSIAFVIQGDAIRNADRGRLGVYLACSGRGRGDGGKISLYREMDVDNYVLQRIIETPASLGICTNILPTASISSEDTTNYVDIYFFDEVSLETVTATDISRSPLINLIRVGNEWLQFRTAAPQTLEDASPYKAHWRVSNLQRGLFGTVASGHAADEYAALADNLIFYDLEPSDVGQTVNLKAVTAGQALDVAPVSTFTFAGNDVALNVIPLFDHFTDATTATTIEETFWSDQIDAGRLAVNGDKVTAEYSGVFAANANEKNVRLYLGGNTLFSSGSIYENGTEWSVKLTLIRQSNTVVRTCVEFSSGVHYTPEYSEVTGLNLTTTDYDLLLTGETPDNAGDITAKMGYGMFIPAATTNTADVMFNGEALTFGGEAVTFTPNAEETASLTTLLTFNAGQVTMFGDSVTFTGA